MSEQTSQEPRFTTQVGDTRITVLGTAHVSRASAEAVETLIRSGDYDAVAVELCPSRHNAIVRPDDLSRMDLFQVLRQGKVPMVTASLALGAYQQRLADQFGIEPGAEMRAAIRRPATTTCPCCSSTGRWASHSSAATATCLGGSDSASSLGCWPVS
jgi:pheromone shutdown protein TraB